MRKIIHIDMDAFYASVEQRDRPELKGRPVIVGGDPHKRGVVCTASYEARAFGVRSAMATSKALSLCPQAIFLRPNFTRYQEVSEQIHRIFSEVTHLIEPLSLDEAYLDVTENHLGLQLARDLALYIKERIVRETGLTASAGVGPNKLIAKIASGYQKPDGLTVVHPKRVLEFMERLPVQALWGVGEVTAKRLKTIGIFQVKDLRQRDPQDLCHQFGHFGQDLWDMAHGRDERPVEPHREPKSRGVEETFAEDITELATLQETLRQQADELATCLMEMGKSGRTLTLKIRFSDFTTYTRRVTSPDPFNQAEMIAETACLLLEAVLREDQRPVRLLGLSVSGFDKEEWGKQLLFDFLR